MPDPRLPKHGRFRLVFDRPHYAVAPGGTATVTVFLRETFDPRTDESLLAPGTDGLVSAAVGVRVGAPHPIPPAFLRPTAAILGNTGFDLALVARMPSPESPGSAGLVELSDRPVFGEVVSRRPTRVTVLLPVGTFTFAAGTVLRWATLRTVLVTEDYPDPCGAGTVTDSGVVLDDVVRPGRALITVSPKACLPGRRTPGVADLLAARTDGQRRRW
jgi:hypothetical protein